MYPILNKFVTVIDNKNIPVNKIKSVSYQLLKFIINSGAVPKVRQYTTVLSLLILFLIRNFSFSQTQIDSD